MPLGGGSLAGVARVAFEATGVGETTRDIDRVERSYRSSMENMSDGAVKLALAEDRLQRSLRKGPSAYASQARAELGVRRARAELTGTTDRLTHAQDRQRRSLGGLRSSVLGLAGGFIGASGLYYAMKRALDVTSSLEEQTDFTRRTFDSAAPSVIRFSQNALGLARDEALAAAAGLGSLLKPLGILPGEAARLSISLTKLGVDLASMKDTPVKDALDALRSGIVGESEPLRRYAVLLSEARVQQVALAQTGKQNVSQLTDQDKVLARVAIVFKDAKQAVGNYGDTIGSVANQEREAQKNWRNTQALVGQTLTPAYKSLLGAVNEYLGSAENQREIQEKVNRAVEAGTEIAHGLERGIDGISTVVRPAIGLMGGLENATTALLVGGITYKSVKAIAAIRALALSFGLVGPAATRSALLANAATASIGAGALTATGRVNTLRGSLLGLARGVTIPVTVALLVDQATGGHGWNQVNKAITDEATAQSGNPRLVNGQWIGPDGAPVQDQAYWKRLFRGGYIDKSGSRRTRRTPIGPLDREDRAAQAKSGARPESARADSGGRDLVRAAGRSMLDIELDLARAEQTATRADDARLRREQIGRFQAQVDALERRKTLTDKQKETLRGLYGSLASAQSALDSIIDEGEQTIAEQRRKAREKREAAEKRRETLEGRAIERHNREAERQASRIVSAGRGRGGRPLGEGRTRMEAAAKSGRGGTGEKGLTQADIDRAIFNAFGSLHGVLAQFGSNYAADGSMGQVATHAYVQTELQREMVRGIHALGRGAGFSGTAFARAELAASAFGVGF